MLVMLQYCLYILGRGVLPWRAPCRSERALSLLPQVPVSGLSATNHATNPRMRTGTPIQRARPGGSVGISGVLGAPWQLSPPPALDFPGAVHYVHYHDVRDHAHRFCHFHPLPVPHRRAVPVRVRHGNKIPDMESKSGVLPYQDGWLATDCLFKNGDAATKIRVVSTTNSNSNTQKNYD